MTATVGQTITWRKPNGRVATMRVDWVHDTAEERWLFSAICLAFLKAKGVDL